MENISLAALDIDIEIESLNILMHILEVLLTIAKKLDNLTFASHLVYWYQSQSDFVWKEFLCITQKFNLNFS